MPLEIKKIGTLEIESSASRSDAIFFLVQKSGIIIMSLIVLAAMLGFFGPGIFGKSNEIGAVIQVQYEKFVRLQATNSIHIKFSSIDTKQTYNTINLAINSNFFKKVSIKSITPEPIQQKIQNDKIIYTFLADQIQNGATITIVIEPEEFGWHTSDIVMVSPKEDIVKITQFIYP